MTPAHDSSILSQARIITLTAAILVALGSGTNYVFSAYAPQLASRLQISHTKLNVVALAGNVGVYSTGPLWGRLVDRRGPQIPLLSAFFLLLIGYSGIRFFYDSGVSEGDSFPAWKFYFLIVFGVMTGCGGNAGLSGSMNATARSFPDRARATATGLVLSGFGLSAFFFSTLAHLIFPGDTSSFLLVLSIGTALPMVIGYLFIKPVPYDSEGPGHSEDGLGSSDRSSSLAGPDGSQTTPLLAEAAEPFRANSSLDLRRSTSGASAREQLDYEGPVKRSYEDPTDVHGKKLLMDTEFLLLFVIFAALSGTGLMFINNVGSMSQVLYAHNNDHYDEATAAQWQATQVSTISIFNFAGRILAGLLSDFTKTRLGKQRSFCLTLVSSIFLISQLTAAGVTEVGSLWKASALLGLAYGALFGLLPTIVIEWFGFPHFSENWGVVSVAPMVGGNVFSLAFGRNLDAHEPHDTDSLLKRAGLPSSSSCELGRACYIDTIHLTIFTCAFTILLTAWAGYRDHQKRGRKD